MTLKSWMMKRTEPPVRLYKLSIKDKKVTRLTTNTDRIQRWSISKDGKYAAAIHGKSLALPIRSENSAHFLAAQSFDGSEKTIFTKGECAPYGFEVGAGQFRLFMLGRRIPPMRDFLPRIYTALFLRYEFRQEAGRCRSTGEKRNRSDLAANARRIYFWDWRAGRILKMARYSRTNPVTAGSWKRHSLEGEHAKKHCGVLKFRGFFLERRYFICIQRPASPQMYRAQIDGDKIVSPVQSTKFKSGPVTGRSFAKSEVIQLDWLEQ